MDRESGMEALIFCSNLSTHWLTESNWVSCPRIHSFADWLTGAPLKSQISNPLTSVPS